jgi:hypothetical protein
MSGFDLPPSAFEFFSDVFPDAVVIEPFEMGDVRDERLYRAGLGIAELLCADGFTCRATYIRHETPLTEALFVIHAEEEAGVLPAGTHDRAIDSVISGEFDDEFGRYVK